MAKQYKSAALAAAHETALGLAEAGVMPKRTMKAFDEMCLTPGRKERPGGGRLRSPYLAKAACFSWSSQGNSFIPHQKRLVQSKESAHQMK